jgi:hypothetical protein
MARTHVLSGAAVFLAASPAIGTLSHALGPVSDLACKAVAWATATRPTRWCSPPPPGWVPGRSPLR